MTLRAFVAVPIGPLPPLQQALDKLAAVGADLKLVPSSQLHITLSFLGDVADDAPRRIEGAMHVAAAHAAPFELSLHGLGAFQSVRKPRVIWAGVAEPAPLVDLARHLRNALERIGLGGAEKPFKPHLTLARTRSSKGLDKLVDFLQHDDTKSLGTRRVEELVLYSSTLTPDGAIHEPFARVPLGGHD